MTVASPTITAPRTTPAEWLSRPLVLGSLLLVIWSIPWMVGGSSVVIDGQRYFFLADDPTISLRYGRNLARGLGLVWTAGERVEGYSNFLWVIYMAALHKLPIPTAQMALAVMLTNVAIAIAGMVLLYKLARRLPGAALLAPLAVAAYAMNGDIFEWMLRGFETSAMATLLLASLYRLLLDADDGRPRLGTYLLIGSLTLVRTDGLVLAGPLLLVAVLTTRQRGRALLLSGLALVMPAAHLLFRWRYYGDLLPNTAYLKMFGWHGRYKAGFLWTLKFYTAYPIAALLVAATAFRKGDWRLRAPALLCLMFTAYTIYVGGDSFSGFRFLAPIIPLFVMIALVSAWSLSTPAVEARLAAIAARVLRPSWIQPALLVAGLAVFVLAAIFWPVRVQLRLYRQGAVTLVGAVGLATAVFLAARRAGHATPARLALIALVLADMPLLFWTHRHPMPWRHAYPDSVRAGLFVKTHTPENAVIGDTWGGVPGYFSERRGIDFLGKCERHVGHMAAVTKGTVPGHNKFDFDYSIGKLHPDFVLAPFKLPVNEADMRAAAEDEDYAFLGRLYFNDSFQRRCLPHPIPAPDEIQRTLFACDWR